MQNLVSFFLIAGLITSCQMIEKRRTNRPMSYRSPQKKSLVEKGEVDQKSPSLASRSEKPTFAQLLETHLSPNEAFTKKDYSILRSLSQRPPKTQLGRAVAVVMSARYVNQVAQDPKLSLRPSQNKSFDSILQKMNIDLVSELKTNVFLQSEPSYALLESAFRNSPDNNPLKLAFLQRNQDRSKLAVVSTTEVVNTPNKQVEPLKNDVSLAAANPDAVEEKSPEQLDKFNEALKIADAMAAQGKYRDSIKKLKLLSNEDPMSKEIRNRIARYSESGIQALRLRASKAFQDSQPVSNLDTKLRFLSQAENHLKQASKDYPDAPESVLDTVSTNLKMIEEQIEEAKTQKLGGPSSTNESQF